MEGLEIGTGAPALEPGTDVSLHDDDAAHEPVEGGEGEQPEGDGAEGEGQGESAEGEQPLIQNGRLSEVAKQAVAELNAKDPKLGRAVQRALFADERLRSEFPGANPFKAIAQLRETIETLGGDEGIQGLQGELNGWRDFDEKWTSGDPAVLQFLTQTPEAKEAFLRIAPLAFDRFQQENPEGYAAYMAQVFLGDMQGEQIPLLLMRLGDLVADKPQAMEALQKLNQYIERLSAFSRKPIAPAAKAAAEPNARASELDQRETNIRRQEWGSEVDRQHGSIFKAAWDRLTKGLPKDKMPLVRELYSNALKERLAAKKDFDANMRRYFDANQRDGFLRLHKSTFDEVVPMALRIALAKAGFNGRKAPAVAQQSNGNGQQRPVEKPAEGWTQVSAKPAFSEINNVLTTPSMYQSGKAILKNGKKVTWA